MIFKAQSLLLPIFCVPPLFATPSQNSTLLLFPQHLRNPTNTSQQREPHWTTISVKYKHSPIISNTTKSFISQTSSVGSPLGYSLLSLFFVQQRTYYRSLKARSRLLSFFLPHQRKVPLLTTISRKARDGLPSKKLRACKRPIRAFRRPQASKRHHTEAPRRKHPRNFHSLGLSSSRFPSPE